MKYAKKLLVIILVLIAPIFVFLFLKGFGSNEFVLPIYYTEGNPLPECHGQGTQHLISEELLVRNDIKIPVLVYFADTVPNKFYSDLNTILDKYPDVIKVELALSDYNSETSSGSLKPDSLSYLGLINCELVLGENEFLLQAVANKFVLIDEERRIRGYYHVTDLEDIERLDVELDILLNY